jgi:polyribonucleotide nucleotidyltransferase
MKLTKSIDIGASPMTIETGHLARQADGSCTVRLGDTVVLATACMDTRSDRPRDFLPLTVDYREYTYAAGRIPGGFFKREGRPSEKEIITSRLIDRPLRPLFPDGYTMETQIISFVLSADGENDPDVLAINGASTALVLSEIPFYHPVGAVRVGLIEGEVVFNPTNSMRDVADLDLMVVGTEEAVVMVEAAANQVSESMVLDCIFKGHEEIQKIIRTQHQLYRDSGLRKPSWTPPEPYTEELYGQVKAGLADSLAAALNTKGKFERKARVSEAVQAFVDGHLEGVPAEQREDRKTQVKKIVSRLEEEVLREQILTRRTRFDDRQLDTIRDISVEVGLLPRTHGSALFTRGETQALV